MKCSRGIFYISRRPGMWTISTIWLSSHMGPIQDTVSARSPSQSHVHRTCEYVLENCIETVLFFGFKKIKI